MNSPQLKDFKIIARHSPVENVDSKPRGDKDHFWDNNDNWTLAWAYEESSSIRPKGTAYWAGFFNTYFTIDFKNDLVDDWREFNKKFVPVFIKNNPNAHKVKAGLACSAIHQVAKRMNNDDLVLCPDGERNYKIANKNFIS